MSHQKKLKTAQSLEYEPLSRKDKSIFTKKLLLHFDQHNTIQVACNLPTRKISVEEGINNFLSSVLWGKEINENEWVWLSTEPQLYKPRNEPDAMTFFKYLEKKIVKSPEDRVELKTRTCRFVYEEPGIMFREFFDLYLNKLIYSSNTENGEQYCLDDNNNLPPNTIPDSDATTNTLYHLILPDFFDLIRRLQKDNRTFAIILRTMGIDSQSFLDTITPIIEGKHRDFKDIKPIRINHNVGQIKRDVNDKIELHMDNEVYSDDDAIYAKLCSLEGINAIRDDFAHWQMCDYECYAAKPLWINLQDNLHQHILFDDNIRLDAVDDCIVNIRLSNFLSNDTYENVEFNSYKLFEKSSILQPNLIELLNPHLKLDSQENHYFKKIRNAELVYHRLITNKENVKITTRKYSTTNGDGGLDSNEKVLDVELAFLSGKQKKISSNITELSENFAVQDTKKATLSRKTTYVDLGNSFKLQFEEEEKQIDDKGRTITKHCIIQ